MPDLGRVSQIDASRFDAGTAYIAVKKPLLADFAPYIFRTHDFGRTWTKIVNGIAANDYTHVVREDTAMKGLLFAGTQHGFYVSIDDGDHWQPLRANLPDTQVSDIWVDANDIAIATHGRSFYVLDNIGPLRQYAAAGDAQPTRSSSSRAMRFASAGPASIAYWLKKQPQSLKLEILDDKGQVVRTFDGALPDGRTGADGAGGAGRRQRASRASRRQRRPSAEDAATPTGETKKAADADAAVRRRRRWRSACSASTGICSISRS